MDKALFNAAFSFDIPLDHWHSADHQSLTAEFVRNKTCNVSKFHNTVVIPIKYDVDSALL